MLALSVWSYQEKFGLLPHNGGKEEYAWNIGNPPGHLLVLFCLWWKSMEYYNPIQTELRAQTLQEWRFGLLHQVKNLSQVTVRCLLKAKGIQNTSRRGRWLWITAITKLAVMETRTITALSIYSFYLCTYISGKSFSSLIPLSRNIKHTSFLSLYLNTVNFTSQYFKLWDIKNNPTQRLFWDRVIHFQLYAG